MYVSPNVSEDYYESCVTINQLNAEYRLQRSSKKDADRTIKTQEWMEGWALSPSSAIKAITTMNSPPFKRIDILNAESVFGAAKSHNRGSTTKPGGVSQPGDRRANVNSVQLHCDIYCLVVFEYL